MPMLQLSDAESASQVRRHRLTPAIGVRHGIVQSLVASYCISRLTYSHTPCKREYGWRAMRLLPLKSTNGLNRPQQAGEQGGLGWFVSSSPIKATHHGGSNYKPKPKLKPKSKPETQTQTQT
jgi:hypothetical protein